MAHCVISQDTNGERATFHISRAFDPAGAWALRALLEKETCAVILLDFSQVGDFSNLGIAVLASGLRSVKGRVSVIGLRRHQSRILQYCGMSVDDPATAG